MEHTVLLVMDVQNILVEEQPYNIKKVIENIKQLLAEARANKTEVLYVRHNEEAGCELETGTRNWEIYHEIAPLADEKIVDKHFSSAFRNTGLKEYLDGKGVKTIVLVGLQTEYCVDATCKSAFEFGYEVIIPEETNSTYDNRYLTADKLYQFYNYSIWNNRFAEVVPMEEAAGYLR